MLRLRFGNILAGGDIVAGLKLWKFLVEIKPNAEVTKESGFMKPCGFYGSGGHGNILEPIWTTRHEDFQISCMLEKVHATLRDKERFLTSGPLFAPLLNFRVALYSGRDKGETRSSEKEVTLCGSE